MAESNSTQLNKFDYIDSLRGVAILMVILVHCSQGIHNLSVTTLWLGIYGQMGVQLFFVLSAFTLCLSADRRTTEKNSLTNFFIRRFFRIAPLYYFGIGFYALYRYCFGHLLKESFFSFEPSLIDIGSNLSFLHGFYPPAINHIVPGGWSIGTEMAFYAIFPFLFFYVNRYSQSSFKLIAISISGFLLCFAILKLTAFFLHVTFVNNSFFYYNLLNQLPVFLVGMSYYFYRKNFNIELNIKISIICFFVITGLNIFLFRYLFNITLVPFVAAVSFVFLIEIFKHYKALNIPVLQRIGQLSYSMYLFHFVFVWLAKQFLVYLYDYAIPEAIFLLFFIVVTAITMIIATISEKTIEVWGIKLGKRIIGRETRIATKNSYSTIK